MNFRAILIISFLSLNMANAQNCNYFLYMKDTLQYEACIIAEERQRYYQYSKEYQIVCDKAIEKCPYYSHAYRHKSTAYLKSGDFLAYEKLMGKAVELDPIYNLGIRGWCRYSFFRNYQGAIEDFLLLERLTGKLDAYSSEGDYHLVVAKALCYKALGKIDSAILILENHIYNNPVEIGYFDYLHLAVCYLQLNKLDEAEKYLIEQKRNNNIAEVHYYLAKVYETSGKMKLYKEELKIAKDLYIRGLRMNHDYSHHQDKVFLSEIENALIKYKNQ